VYSKKKDDYKTIGKEDIGNKIKFMEEENALF
jgi:hypothetical protein